MISDVKVENSRHTAKHMKLKSYTESIKKPYKTTNLIKFF